MRSDLTRVLKKAGQDNRLGSRERVGRYTRKLAWEQITSFARRNWVGLLVLLLLPMSCALIVSFFMKGIQRWIFIGAMGASSPWLVAMMILLYTGVGNTLMGLEGENFTAEVLREFRSAGWILINGIKIKQTADIDHVLVGPAGLLVIESKWSHHRWPSITQEVTFMTGAIEKAITQALRNSDDVKWRFGKELKGVPIKAVCVLWSSDFDKNDPLWFEHRNVLVVRGSGLDAWLKSLTEQSLDRSRIEKISSVIGHQALSRDEYELAKSGPPPRTFGRFVFETVITPLIGSMLVLYGFIIIGLVHQVWFFAFPLSFFALAGFWAHRIPRLRGIAIGLLLGDAIYSLILTAKLIQFFVR